MRFLSWCLVLVECLVFFTQAKEWHNPCPRGIEPIQDFQMSRFLGQWYAIWDTGMYYSRCITYNYDYTPEKTPGEYVLNITQFYFSDLFPISPISDVYNLTVTDPTTPGRMETEYTMRLPPRIDYGIKNVSHVVFMTDYDTYAGVFEYLPDTYGHRATILSKTKTLDGKHLTMLFDKLDQCGFPLGEMKFIRHSDCPERNSSITIPYNDTVGIKI